MKIHKKAFLSNILFILVFLNVWDFSINRQIFNGMLLGIIFFGPVSALWFLGGFRASALAALISIFEVMVLGLFIAEGFRYGDAAIEKSLFWVPYLFMAFSNTFLGLRVYGRRLGKNRAI